MAGTQGDDVTPRKPGEPTPQQIYDLMEPGVPYVSSELAEIVREEIDSDNLSDSKWTIKRRLESLADDDLVESKRLPIDAKVFWRRADDED